VKKSRVSWFAPEHVLLLVVDIQNIQFPRPVGEGAAPCAQKAPQDGRAEGIEEKRETGAGGEREVGGVAAKHAHGRAGTASCAPDRHIFAADARQTGMQFYADDGSEGIRRGQQHGAAHTGAEVHECVCVNGGDGTAAAPANNDVLKDRGRDGVIGRDMAVVTMAGGEMTPGNQSAGAHAKLEIEGMADEAVADREPLQQARL